MTLQGKKVLVTGASRGIGREIALEFARLGADVAVNYAGNEAKANEVVAEIKALGQDAIAIQCDVSNSEQVTEMVKATIDHFGCLDILVNNAGITRDNLLNAYERVRMGRCHEYQFKRCVFVHESCNKTNDEAT